MIRSSYTPRLVSSPAAGKAMRLLPIFSAMIFFAFGAKLSPAQQLATLPFFKTSFDCSKAKWLSIEEAICKNEKLARLDVEAADAYRKRLDSGNPSEKEQVIASQRR